MRPAESVRADWIAPALVACGDATPDRAVAWRDDSLVRRAGLLASVDAWQAAFAAHPGRRAALYFEDSHAFACALYGAWHAGKEVVIPGDALPATLERLHSLVDILAGDLPGAIAPVPGGGRLSRAPLDPVSTRLTVFTSGSSGEPVAIEKKLSQIDSEISHLEQAFGATMDAREPATILATVTHQHIYGLLFCVFWPLAAGRPVDTQRLAYPEQMAARLAVRPGVLVSSPAHLKRLGESTAWALARGALLGVFSSGGPLPPEAAVQARTLLGHSPIEVYGSSETGGIAWRQRERHGDLWEPLPGIDWTLRQELLCVRSGHLADDQWWLTSDRARDAGGGRFVLQGRVDRIVKIEEKRVSLTAVEEALRATGLVLEARALVLEHGEAAGRMALVTVPTAAGWDRLAAQGRRACNEQLRTVLGALLERVALPRRVRHLRALPVNTQGKTTDAMLQALFRPAMPTREWVRRGPDECVVRLAVADGLAPLEGHFPGLPVLPGVAQVDWIIAIGRDCFALPASFLGMEALKFHQPVVPGDELELLLRWREATGTLEFRLGSIHGAHASGRIRFGHRDA